LVEVGVVVEVSQPRRLVGRVDVPVQAVLLVPPPLAVGLRLGVERVVEVGRQCLAHLGVGLPVDRQRLVVLPGGRLQDPPDAGDVLGVALLVAGLVHREHMTSWGFTSATVRNHGRSSTLSGPACSDSQWAAFER